MKSGLQPDGSFVIDDRPFAWPWDEKVQSQSNDSPREPDILLADVEKTTDTRDQKEPK